MLYDYKYDNGVRVKIWVDDIPLQQNIIVKTISKKYSDALVCFDSNKNLAVELCLPKNCSNYAMLGVIYTAKSQEANVRIGLSDYEAKEYLENIALKSDCVHEGIPEYYLGAIEKSIDNFYERKLLHNGLYEFSVGAHGEVGSSEMIFMVTANILLELISGNEYTKENVEKIIRKLYKQN
jgi:hypothetical protein